MDDGYIRDCIDSDRNVVVRWFYSWSSVIVGILNWDIPRPPVVGNRRKEREKK